MNVENDVLADRTVNFMFKGEHYKAVWKKRRSYWTIFNNRGVIVPEQGNTELWEHFTYHKEPKDLQKARKFLQAGEAERLAIETYGDDPHSFGAQRDGFVKGYKAAEARIKELESKDSLQEIRQKVEERLKNCQEGQKFYETGTPAWLMHESEISVLWKVLEWLSLSVTPLP